MKLSYKWLKEFVEIELTPQEVAERLTMAGIEVTAVLALDKGIRRVVSAEVRTVSPHPNADKLTYCAVFNGKEELVIVCGAKNIKPGDKVPLALVGAVLPGNKEIHEAEIRGMKSFGMMCSERELGISEDAGGIMILPPATPLGADLNEILDLDDVILEVEPTPNRGDVLSVLGMARELAALLGVKVKMPPQKIKEAPEIVEQYAAVEIKEPHLCPRYTARYVDELHIGPSPLWIQNRLRNCGLRPINNIVDITNYVLWELGQPLHAFDYDQLAEHKIIVRTAAEGEEIVTLDGNTRKLAKGMLVIADAHKPVALAGIMGGEFSSVTERTKKVLLESAYFDPVVVRKTARRLGLTTDASYRFERGVDMENIIVALNRISSLIGDVAQGHVAKGIFDVYVQKLKTKKITVRQDRIDKILGLQIPFTHTRKILKNLGFVFTENTTTETFNVAVPTWRNDIEREIEVIEEVARLNGYEEIPATLPKGIIVRLHRHAEWEEQVRLRGLMQALGFSEVVNYSFISDKDYEKIGIQPSPEILIRLGNPLSEETAVMRTTLLCGVLNVVARNLNYGNTDIKIFELGQVFQRWQKEEKISSESAPSTYAQETRKLVFALTKPKDQKVLYGRGKPVDIFSVKGVIECVLSGMGVEGFEFQPLEQSFLQSGCGLGIFAGEVLIGFLGKISGLVSERYDISQDVFVGEIAVDKIQSRSHAKRLYQKIPKVPGVRRDVALLLPATISYARIMEVMRAAAHPLVKKITLFDVYQGGHVEPGYKSHGYALFYQHDDRTLQDKEVNQWHQEFVQRVINKLGAKVR